MITADARRTPIGDFATFRPVWHTLAERSGNLFATWEWMTIWWRHFGNGRRLALTACNDEDGRVVALLPLYFWSERPLRVVRFLGHGAADELGPICAWEDRGVAAAALRQSVDALGCDVLIGDVLPGETNWPDLLDGTVLRREGSPLLRPGTGGWAEFVAQRSAKFRKQLRQTVRRLERSYRVRFRLASDPEQLDRDLDTLFELHAARWAGRRSEFGGRTEAFHREFARIASERGWLRLWFLELDDRPAAVSYMFRFGGIEWDYQGGRDPAYRDFSVGFVLQQHTMRAAFEEGVTEYRLLRGGEPYKYRFTNADPQLLTVAVPRTRAGAVATRAAALAEPFRQRRLRALRALRRR